MPRVGIALARARIRNSSNKNQGAAGVPAAKLRRDGSCAAPRGRRERATGARARERAPERKAGPGPSPSRTVEDRRAGELDEVLGHEHAILAVRVDVEREEEADHVGRVLAEHLRGTAQRARAKRAGGGG